MLEEQAPIDQQQPPVENLGDSSLLAGLVQRARLMEALSQDVYGAQDTLRQGLIPAALTLGHPAYQPALQGLQPTQGRWLSWIGFDAAMGPNGQWLILKQTSSPDVRILRSALASAPQPEALQWMRTLCEPTAIHHGGADSWAVMLTKDSQWPHVHPDWGLKVVHPQDLQIRDRQLWHIGPQGSFRIQTVLNLTGQETTDPLEIRPHDHAGIAGLFDVLRQQALTWVNPPGLGFLDSAAWHGFWPALTRQILQEDLLLPSLTTWWMGERDIHPLAWQTLAQALLTPTFPDDGLRPSRHPVQVDFNRPGELDAWRSVLVHEAEDWVMQQPTPLTNQRSMLLLIGPDGISHMMSLHGQPLDETGIRP